MILSSICTQSWPRFLSICKALYDDYNCSKIELHTKKEAAKRKYFENLFSEANGNRSETWKVINKLLRKPKRKTTAMPQSIKIGIKSIECPESICYKMNEHFVTIGKKLSANVKSTIEQGFKKFLGKRQMSSIVLRPTDEHEVVEILAGLSNNKSPGYIDIPVTLIKESKFVIGRYLSNSLNKCITNGTFPNILVVAKVVALHNGGFKSELSNYRPISILSFFNKCFEKILHKRFADYWEKNNLFHKYQFGFRKIIRPILLSLICMKQFCKNVMTINRFVTFFWILRRHSIVSTIKFY